MIGRITLVLFVCGVCSGCAEPADEQAAGTSAVASSQSSAQTSNPPVPPPPVPPRPTRQADETRADQEDEKGRITADEYVDAKRQRREGDNYKSNYVRTVVTAYDGFGIQDRVALDQMEKMLLIFESAHGRKPRTHEEAMEAIKGCRLPELDEGCSYVYDPEKGQFMVEHPS